MNEPRGTFTGAELASQQRYRNNTEADNALGLALARVIDYFRLTRDQSGRDWQEACDD